MNSSAGQHSRDTHCRFPVRLRSRRLKSTQNGLPAGTTSPRVSWKSSSCRKSSWRPPVTPSERKYLPFANLNTVGLLHRPHFPPLVESVRRDEAVFRKNRISNCRCRCDGLRPCVERAISNANVFCHEGINPQRIVVKYRTFLPCSRHTVKTGCVGAVLYRGRFFNFISGRLKTFGEVLLRVRQSVSVKHQFIVADRSHFVA